MSQRNPAAPRLLAPLLLALALLPADAPCAAWQENIGLLVRIDGQPEGNARLFDSEDYQQMLLVLADRPAAMVLELADGTVGSIPRDSVRIGSDGQAHLGPVGSEYLGDCTRDNGVIAFSADGMNVEIAPLPPLIGEVSLVRLLELKPSYAVASKAYKPEPIAMRTIKGLSEPTEFSVYFGTWCHLCKKMVPDFIRIVEQAANPKIQVRYIGVDENLTQPEGEIRDHHLTKTPTIVVRQGGREIGRIEEKALKSVEADLVEILMHR